MKRSDKFRITFIILICAVIYYGFIGVISESLPYATIPEWWRVLWFSPKFSMLCWFAALNATSALLSSIPVALVISFRISARRTASSLVVGVLVALSIVVSSFIQYGPFSRIAAFDSLAQFICVGLAMPLVTMLVEKMLMSSGYLVRRAQNAL